LLKVARNACTPENTTKADLDGFKELREELDVLAKDQEENMPLDDEDIADDEAVDMDDGETWRVQEMTDEDALRSEQAPKFGEVERNAEDTMEALLHADNPSSLDDEIRKETVKEELAMQAAGSSKAQPDSTDSSKIQSKNTAKDMSFKIRREMRNKKNLSFRARNRLFNQAPDSPSPIPSHQKLLELFAQPGEKKE
jgi:hypothetical protein